MVGRPVDGAAKVITGLGDHGLLWTGVAAWRGRRSGPERAKAVRALAIAGVVIEPSSTPGSKRSSAAPGPTAPTCGSPTAACRYASPRPSSFPSGHTLAAFCAATVLAEPGDRPGNALL